MTALPNKPKPPRLRSALWLSLAAHAASALGSILTVPFFLRAFGATEFGFWSSLLGLTTYLSLLNLGIAQTVASRASTLGQQSQAVWASVRRGVSQYARVIAVAAPSLFVAGLIVPWVRIFKLPDSSTGSSRWAAIAVGLTFLFELPASVFRAALQGTGRVAYERAINIAASALRVAVAWVLAVTQPPLWAGVVALSVVNLSASAACFWALRRLLPGSLRSEEETGGRPVKDDDFTSSGIHFLLLQISGAVLWGSDSLIVGLMKGPTDAAHVAVAFRLLSFGMMIGGLVVPALGPFLAQSWAAGDKLRARRLGLESGQVMTAVSTVTALGFGVAGAPFIRVWVGREHFVGQSTWLLYCGTIAIQGLLIIPHAFLTHAGMHRRYARWSIVEAAAKLALSVGLLPVVGIAALPLGTLVARIATSCWVLVVDYSREVGEAPWSWSWRSLRVSAAPTLCFAGVYGALSYLLSGMGDVAYLVAATSGGVAFVLVFLVKGIAPETRKRLLGMVRPA